MKVYVYKIIIPSNLSFISYRDLINKFPSLKNVYYIDWRWSRLKKFIILVTPQRIPEDVVETEWSRPQLFKPIDMEEIRDDNLSNEEFERIRNNSEDIDEEMVKNYQYTYEIEKVLERAIKKEYGK